MTRHESAYLHSQEAAKLADKALLETYKACREHLLSNKKLRKPSQLADNCTAALSPGFESAVKVYPTLKDLVERLGTKVFASAAPARKLDLRSVLGVHHFDHWIYSFNIGELMVVPVISLGDVKKECSPSEELGNDSVLEKICLLAVSYFSIAAESRFLSRRSPPLHPREGELWHKKALSISQDFLPTECPLSRHIKQSYARNYPPEAEKRLHSSSPHARKSVSKPMLKTFDFTSRRAIGFRSPKGGTAEEIVEQILGKSGEPGKPGKRKNSVLRARTGSVRRRCSSSKRQESGIKVVEMPVTTIPTEESDGCTDMREMSRSLHLSQEEGKVQSPLCRRTSTGVRKVNVSILTFNEDDQEDDRQPSKENEESSGEGVSQRSREEEIILTSSVLYGENIGAKEEKEACKGDNQGKEGKKGRL